MKPSKVELAVLNNVRWYEAVFEAHGLASEIDELVWLSRQTAPPFHSNLVVVSPGVRQDDIEAYVDELGKPPRPAGWSIKDSYARFDLSSLGFAQLFQAEWLWRDRVPMPTREAVSRLAWNQVATATALMEWEHAWAGDARNETAAPMTWHFPQQLLASPDLAFFAGRLDGEIVAGGIANRSPGVIGLSNVFSPEALADDAWNALATCLSTAFPNAPLVGYERGADLRRAVGAGFAPIGALRVWCRSA